MYAAACPLVTGRAQHLKAFQVLAWGKLFEPCTGIWIQLWLKLAASLWLIVRNSCSRLAQESISSFMLHCILVPVFQFIQAVQEVFACNPSRHVEQLVTRHPEALEAKHHKRRAPVQCVLNSFRCWLVALEALEAQLHHIVQETQKALDSFCCWQLLASSQLRVIPAAAAALVSPCINHGCILASAAQLMALHPFDFNVKVAFSCVSLDSLYF